MEVITEIEVREFMLEDRHEGSCFWCEHAYSMSKKERYISEAAQTLIFLRLNNHTANRYWYCKVTGECIMDTQEDSPFLSRNCLFWEKNHHLRKYG